MIYRISFLCDQVIIEKQEEYLSDKELSSEQLKNDVFFQKLSNIKNNKQENINDLKHKYQNERLECLLEKFQNLVQKQHNEEMKYILYYLIPKIYQFFQKKYTIKKNTEYFKNIIYVEDIANQQTYEYHIYLSTNRQCQIEFDIYEITQINQENSEYKYQLKKYSLILSDNQSLNNFNSLLYDSFNDSNIKNKNDIMECLINVGCNLNTPIIFEKHFNYNHSTKDQKITFSNIKQYNYIRKKKEIIKDEKVNTHITNSETKETTKDEKVNPHITNNETKETTKDEKVNPHMTNSETKETTKDEKVNSHMTNSETEETDEDIEDEDNIIPEKQTKRKLTIIEKVLKGILFILATINILYFR